MKQTDFILAFSEEIQKTKKETKEIIDKFIALIAKVVKKGDEVALPELGKFLLKKSPAREGRNPMTGETVKIAAKVTPKFRPSKKFKEALLGTPAKKK